jgi:prephenate dehydratase
MSRFYLIGGHDFDSKNNYIAKRLLRLSHKEKPNILLIPLASKDSERTISNFKREYNGLNYTLNILLLTKKPNCDEIKETIAQADILFFSGGSTAFLIEFLKKNNLTWIIYDSLKRDDLIIAGVSAGAIMLSRFGLTDQEAYEDHDNFYNFKELEGLGILDIGLCPHYNLNDRMLYFSDMVKNHSCDSYALDEDTALYVENGIYKPIYALKKRHIYQFKKDKQHIMEKMELKKLITLGPSGTFSEVAGLKLSEALNEEYKIEFYPTISLAAKNIAANGFGILPFENTLDGYVQETLDMLHKYNFYIQNDISVPVHFGFVSKNANIANVKKIYVQFKAKGQCLDFINEHGFEIIETESNVTSYERLKNSGETYGAIIPLHLDMSPFKTVVENVEDSKNNNTRFLVLTTTPTTKAELCSKCSLILEALIDEPGILIEALVKFYALKINLNAIMSRPTKEGLGKYYFYTEFLANTNIDEIKGLISRINEEGKFKIKCLGFYKAI